MINAITFTNRYGRSLRCVLAAPYLSSFAIKSVIGLGPGAATINIHDIATADGGYFGSARFGTRNIVVNFILMDRDRNGNYVPIEQTRLLSYEFFAPKSKIRIIVETDQRELSIEGYVETNEPNIFSNQESIQVSILCPDYYFKMINNGNDVQVARLYGGGLFEFPFSNESIEGEKLIQFGNVNQNEHYKLYYDGDAENGFKLTITFRGTDYPVTGTIIVLNQPIGNSNRGDIGYLPNDEEAPSWVDAALSSAYISINLAELASRLGSPYSGANPTAYIYDIGNRIEISTITGKKSAKFIAGNTTYNILGYIPHLEWLKIYPGYNEFIVECNNSSVGHFTVNAEFECLYSGA